jgi:hypothetical protein
MAIRSFFSSGCTRSRGLFAALLGLCVLLLAPSTAAGAEQWLGSSPISDAGVSSQNADVATGPDGTVIAVWSRIDAGEIRIQARVRPPGGDFGPAEFLSASGQQAITPKVAIDGQGNAIVAWYQGGAVHFAARPPGGPFSELTPQSNAGESPTGAVRVAFDAQGSAIVAWQTIQTAMMSNTLRVRAAVRPPGGQFGAAQLLDTALPMPGDPSPIIDNVELATDGQGNAVAVWGKTTSMGAGFMSHTIQAALRAPGGSFGAATPLASTMSSGGTGSIVRFPDVAADDQGTITAVWHFDPSSGPTAIQARTRPPGGSFGPVETASVGAGANPIFPRIATDAQGNAVALWQGTVAAASVVQAAVRPVGGGFGIAQTISEAGASSDSARIASSPGGKTFAVWRRTSGTQRILSAVRQPGGGFGGPIELSPGGGFPNTPEVAADPEGNAVATWTRSDGSDNRIEAAGYDGAPPRLESPQIPASGRTGTPLDFSVAPVDVWSAVTTDWSFGDGATANGNQVSHTYAATGKFGVAVSATDALGNSSTTGGETDIADGIVPLVNSAAAKPTTFALNPKGKSETSVAGKRASVAAKRAKKGTTFKYSLSESARVVFTIERALPGRKVGGKCKKPSRSNRKKKRCTRYKLFGRFAHQGAAGNNSKKWSGKIGKKKVSPGKYRATLVATDAGGNKSQPKRLNLKVVRR